VSNFVEEVAVEADRSASNSLGVRRILLKVSGEVLIGKEPYGICIDTTNRVAEEIARAARRGIELCLVIGGGNIFRGLTGAARGMDRVSADYMGMLATVMNALALQSALERIGMDTRVLSGITMTAVCEPYIRRRAIRHMEKGRIVIFAAGTGSPFFTTDTAAALRAAEMNCDALFKGTGVDGVYSADPKVEPDAQWHSRLTYQDVLARDLRVMDSAAVSLMRDSSIPIVVFSIREKDGLERVLDGTGRFTVIHDTL
jgi:uridylate kinase